MVLAEAMAVGVPVVATDVGGIPEVVVDGETGILVSSTSPTHLADAVSRVLEKREAMGRRAVIAAKRFEAAAYAERIEQLLVRALTEQQRWHTRIRRLTCGTPH
jgi:glycosyltransferase involved in cell wall biosynthesis